MPKPLIGILFAAVLPALAAADPGDPGEPPFGPPPPDAPGHHGHKGGHGPKDFFGQLNLTKEQRQKIGPLLRDAGKERHAIFRKYFDKLSDADKAAFKKEISAAQQKHEADFRALLTPEQQKKLDQLKPKRKAHPVTD